LAYFGDYTYIFLYRLQQLKWKFQREMQFDILGMGLDGQWVVDIQSLVSKFPLSVWDNEDTFLFNLMDIINIIVLEEVSHSLGVLSHNKNNFFLHIFYKIIKNKDNHVQDFFSHLLKLFLPQLNDLLSKLANSESVKTIFEKILSITLNKKPLYRFSIQTIIATCFFDSLIINDIPICIEGFALFSGIPITEIIECYFEISKLIKK